MKHKLGLLLVVVVVVISVVGVASAQQGQLVQPDPPIGGREPILRELAQIVADDLSIEPAELLDQLQDQTLAEVITANGGSIETVTADVTAALTDRINTALENGRITQERADEMLSNLPELIDSALNGEFRVLRGFRAGLRGEFGQRGGLLRNALRLDALPLINAAADATGLTVREIANQLRSGSTLSEIITANGSTPEAVIAAAVQATQTRLDEAVANGRLTQEQADDILTGLQAFYEAVMSGALRPAAPSASDGTVSFVTDAANA